MGTINRISAAASHRPWTTLGITALIFVASIVSIVQFYSSDFSESTFYPDNEQVDLLQQVQERYNPDADLVRVIVELPNGGLTSDAAWADLQTAEVLLADEPSLEPLQLSLFGGQSHVGPASLAHTWLAYVDPSVERSWLSAVEVDLGALAAAQNETHRASALAALETSALGVPAYAPFNTSQLAAADLSDSSTWLPRLVAGANLSDRLDDVLGGLAAVAATNLTPAEAGRVGALQGQLGAALGPHLAINSLDHAAQLRGFVPADLGNDWTADADLAIVTLAVSTDKALFDALGLDADPAAHVYDAGEDLQGDLDDAVNGEARVFSFSRFSEESGANAGAEIGMLSSIALVVLGVILWFRIRSKRDTFAILGVTSVAIVAAYGVGSALGITFNPAMNSIPILLLALGVDYGLHVVLRFREEMFEAGEHDPADRDPLPKAWDVHAVLTKEERRAALARATGLTAGVLVVAIVTDAVGFISFRFSSQQFLVDFGTLIAVGLVLAFLGAITALPALLSVMKPKPIRLPKRQLGEGRIATTLAPLVNKPWAVVGVTLLLTIPLAAGVSQLEVGFDTRSQFNENEPVVADFLILTDRFARGPSLQYLVVDGEALSPAGRSAHDAALAILVDDEDIAGDPIGLWGALERARPRDAQLDTLLADVEATPTTTTYAALSTYLLTTEPGRQVSAAYLAEDGQQSVVTFEAATIDYTDTVNLEQRLSSAASEASTSTHALAITGQGFILAQITEEVAQASIVSLAVVGVVILGMLVFTKTLRHQDPVRGLIIGGPLLIVVAWVYGGMGWIGLELNSQSITIGALTLGLGIDYAVHISGRMEEEAELHPDASPEVWARKAIDTTGQAMVAAAFTTAGGFAVLTLSGIAPIRLFGQVFVVAILLALLSSLAIIPALLTPRLVREQARRRGERALLPIGEEERVDVGGPSLGQELGPPAPSGPGAIVDLVAPLAAPAAPMSLGPHTVPEGPAPQAQVSGGALVVAGPDAPPAGTHRAAAIADDDVLPNEVPSVPPSQGPHLPSQA